MLPAFPLLPTRAGSSLEEGNSQAPLSQDIHHAVQNSVKNKQPGKHEEWVAAKEAETQLDTIRRFLTHLGREL